MTGIRTHKSSGSAQAFWECNVRPLSVPRAARADGACRSEHLAFRRRDYGQLRCLSALFTAGRDDELIELVQTDVLWSYKRWAVKAMAAQGRGAEAIAYAERCRRPWASDYDIDRLCEQP